jgi:hypothetical protein
MRRILSALLVTVGLLAAVTFGFALVDVMVPGAVPLGATGDTLVAGSMSTSSRAVIYAGLGVFVGIVLAWCLRIDWAGVPNRFRAWLDIQRRRAAWIALGCVSTGVLLFF